MCFVCDDKKAENKVKSMIKEMTIDEKIDQMLISDLNVLANQIENGEKPRIYGGAFMFEPISKKLMQKVIEYAKKKYAPLYSYYRYGGVAAWCNES